MLRARLKSRRLDHDVLSGGQVVHAGHCEATVVGEQPGPAPGGRTRAEQGHDTGRCPG